MSLTEQMLVSLPGSPLASLKQADDLWLRYRTGNLPEVQVMHQTEDPLEAVEWDVVICGGTLGIMVGVGLAQRGWRVALLERGRLQGRQQEWNISRRELVALTELGLLTTAELEEVIASEYNPARIQFGDGEPLWVNDVLNVGVDPRGLLERLKEKFLATGGKLFERQAFETAWVHPNGVRMQATGQDSSEEPAPSRVFTTRLLVDAMGHFSPLVRQARGPAKPDALCLVVGSCAEGFAANETGDLIVSFTPLRHQCQYFWEAFPARDGRTTYLFTYMDADPRRLSLSELFEEYWQLLPEYQQVSLEELQVKRALFGFFPCYRHSPLQYPWGRSLAVGDSSGSQSPLSFGGFGAMIRHLERLVRGIDEALASDCLTATALGALQPYQPNLSVTWLFQRSMSVGVDQNLAEQHINTMLTSMFAAMAGLGEPTLKPFLQDVVQFPALAKTLAMASIKSPGVVAKVIPQVGIGSLGTWFKHYISLAGYSALDPLARTLGPLIKLLPRVQRYYIHRWQDSLF
ncbi:MAG: FAD-binding oxidoreductase, partial [Cyanobacteria bacterium J06638_6]